MDSLRFDRLTRRFADISVPLATPAGMSRRTVLRGAVAGVVSTMAVARAPQPASAALCPIRVRRKGHRPTINGCGPSGFGWAIPDSFGRAEFTQACNRHDRCYGTCNENRLKCDVLLRKSMKAACKRAYRDDREGRARCNGIANLYFKKVHESGLSAYEDAQREACVCCGTDRTPCGESPCCPSGHECCNNVCRLSHLGPWDACSARHACCPEGQVCCDGADNLAACCSPDDICVPNCLGLGVPGCCPAANPDCCTIGSTGPANQPQVLA